MVSTALERLPPQNVEAEQALLGRSDGEVEILSR